MTLVYNPRADIPANHFVDETIQLLDRSVFPVNGAFFGEGFSIEAFNVVTEVFETLDLNREFSFSPMFLSPSAKTGKDVYSYIVITVPDISIYNEVRITYDAIGADLEDTALLQKVTYLSPTDRQSKRKWLEISVAASYPLDTRDPELQNKSPLEVTAGLLERLQTAVGLLQGGDRTEEIQRISSLQTSIEELTTRVTALEQQ